MHTTPCVPRYTGGQGYLTPTQRPPYCLVRYTAQHTPVRTARLGPPHKGETSFRAGDDTAATAGPNAGLTRYCHEASKGGHEMRRRPCATAPERCLRVPSPSSCHRHAPGPAPKNSVLPQMVLRIGKRQSRPKQEKRCMHSQYGAHTHLPAASADRNHPLTETIR